MSVTPFAIFDVDGTLIDSRYVINTAMARAFQAQGLTAPDYEQTRRVVGLSLVEAIDFLAPRETTPDILGQLVEGYKQEFVRLRKSDGNFEKPYDGIIAMLTQLKTDGWKLGIATGKSRRGLNAMLSHQNWESLFDCHYCADDGLGKPDPFMITANLTATTTSPEHAVMIGDTSFDMLMARAAGVRALGVNWGFHNEKEIIEGGANGFYRSVPDLQNALNDFAATLS